MLFNLCFCLLPVLILVLVHFANAMLNQAKEKKEITLRNILGFFASLIFITSITLYFIWLGSEFHIGV